MTRRHLIRLMIPLLILISCRTVSPRATAELRNDPSGEKLKLMKSAGDLVDLFVFPSPRKPDHVALGLNVVASSKELAFFSDRVNYAFYLREIPSAKPNKAPTLKVRDFGEKVIMCWFSTPKDTSRHEGYCSLPKIGQVNSKLGEVATGGAVLFYHGLRRDPFEMSRKTIKPFLAEKSAPKLEMKQPRSQNVLSIVLEFNPAEIFGRDVDLLAVVAQSYTTSSNGSQQVIDRLGRPHVKDLLMPPSSDSDDLGDRYKTERPFEVIDKNRLLYGERFSDNVSKFDQLDKSIQWDEDSRIKVVDILLDDYLVFSMMNSKNGTRFLAIEDAALNGKAIQAFGGRGLGDDSFGGVVSFLVARQIPAQSETVSKKKKTDEAQFPYFAPPDPKWAGVEGQRPERPNIRW